MDEQEQLFFSPEIETGNQEVVCLGLKFNNDEERRTYFRNELRKKLPQLKEIEGFPVGEDEDIIALSDPPYFTACPNPWLNDFIKQNQNQTSSPYLIKPFIGDVSHGKNDAVYNAHSYHTKVPYKAIMRYILHYTKPGDFILDGFSGTGMTGVAAKRCSNINDIKSLGYSIKENIVWNGEHQLNGIGERNTILLDLSPAAALISQNYNQNFNIHDFEVESRKILKELEQKCSWLYTLESEKSINYTVWSDVFLCTSCSSEIVYWDAVVEFEKKNMKKLICCPTCGITLDRKKMERAWTNYYDDVLKTYIKIAKEVPVLTNYSKNKKRYDDLNSTKQKELLLKIENYTLNTWFPSERMTNGEESRRNDKIGITHTHHYYTKRNLIVLSTFYDLISKSKYRNQLLFYFQASITRATKTNRFRFGGTGGLSGTLYIPSLKFERNVILLLKNKLRDFLKMLHEHSIVSDSVSYVSTQSLTSLENVSANSIDYIFTDPPFGSNLMYSELNFLWEVWLKILTNNTDEAIVNSVQGKKISHYQKLMENVFKQYFRVLKPNRWITIEFSNSQASVWNSIQDALQNAGFIIADVSALDKKQGSFKAVTSTVAVKQDLVITAYKPSIEQINKVNTASNSEESSWRFVELHLNNLPIINKFGSIPERTPRILFDRMVAYHVRNNIQVPISSADFQKKIVQKFISRDGMIFLDSQVAEYDKERILIKEFSQMTLFVSDENSAIEWIRQQLLKKTQTRQDLHPNFMKEIQHISKHEQLPELDDLLSQNFLRFDDEEAIVPSQILTYLRRNYPDLRGLDASHPAVIKKALHRWYVPDPNKQADLEKLREKALLREFNLYVEEMATSKKKLKVFRTEAIRAGFKKAWSEKDFQTIITVGDRLPETIIQEDDKLLMYYDNAQIKLDM